MKERNSEKLVVYVYIALVAMYVLGIDVDGLINHLIGAAQNADGALERVMEAKSKAGPLMTLAGAVIYYNHSRSKKKIKEIEQKNIS